MHIGTAYYPEIRPREHWDADFEKMRAAGIQRIRIAEFAWSALETEPGTYNWGWLDQSIELAAVHGLEVVLCTPTPCPPIWLVEQHPDVLPVDKFGRRTLFGARQHRCYHAPAYVEHSKSIVRAMAARYGKHPNVVAWQLDNELGGEQKRCHCDHCRRAFHTYLETRYGTVDALNQRWGNRFWSQDYQRWDQIPVPIQHASDLTMRHHPSLEMAYTRFSSDTIVSFSRMQSAILREYTQVPITTNAFMFRWGDNLDWYDLFEDLDVVGVDLYTTDLYEIAFYADFCRSLKQKPFWVLEYGAQMPNIKDAMDVLAKHDCQGLFIFKFNPTPAGQEQSMKSLLTITGAPTPNYEVVKAWSPPQQADGPSPQKPQVGLVYDFDSAWAHAIARWHAPYEEQLAYAKVLIHTVYRALFEQGAAVRFVRTAEDMAACEAVIAPWHLVHHPDLENALIDYVKAGGKLVTTVDLFHKDTDNVYRSEVPRLYRELLDWHENTFIEAGEDNLVRTARAGDGQSWMVRTDITLKAWKDILKLIITT